MRTISAISKPTHNEFINHIGGHQCIYPQGITELLFVYSDWSDEDAITAAKKAADEMGLELMRVQVMELNGGLYHRKAGVLFEDLSPAKYFDDELKSRF